MRNTRNHRNGVEYKMNVDGEFVILVTGGRDISDPDPIRHVLQRYIEEYGATNILLRQGMAKGADSIAKFIARRLGIKNIQDFPVTSDDWLRYGKAAGNIRNEIMLDTDPIPNIVLAFPDNNSRGTYNCIDQAIKRDIDVKVYFDYLSPDNPKRMKYYFYEGVSQR